jgi:hypothetical protein
MKPFPRDKDLAPGDKMAAMVLEDRHLNNAPKLKTVLELMKRQYGDPADLIVLTVPRGKGKPFVDGLMRSINEDSRGS